MTLECIPVGRENAVTTKQLCNMLGVSPRRVRREALASLAKIKACREWSADQIRMGEEQ